MDRAFAGDPEAFSQIVRSYQRPVLGLCARLMRGEDARDLAQETFVRLWRTRDDIRIENELTADRALLHIEAIGRPGSEDGTAFDPAIGFVIGFGLLAGGLAALAAFAAALAALGAFDGGDLDLELAVSKGRKLGILAAVAA